MKKQLFYLALILCALLPFQARAIDPGTVSGTLTIDKDVIQLKHVYAHLHDNAEGWLDSREMRILLTDRTVPQETVAGLNVFLALAEMLKQDKVRGVLLRFDPATPNSIVITNLYPPKDPNESLANKSLSYGDRSPIDKLAISEQRVSGALKLHSDGNQELGWPLEDYAVSFSAPLFREPAITSDISGAKALKSPQVAVLQAKCAAIVKGDMQKAREYSTDRSNREIDTYLAQAGEETMRMLQQMAGEQEKSLKTAEVRLVERGNRAALIVNAADGKSLINFAKDKGKWKID
ncbi:MAG TPA: hypothetical protein VIH45_13300 [Desulfuromonadaceae bacterium]